MSDKLIEYDKSAIFPRFLLEDREGFAMASAIAAGIDYFLTVAKGALDVWGDVDTMPEWRLDELAWEYDIIYDAFADVETKRAWIRDAVMLSKQTGTKAGIVKLLEAKFDTAYVQEWFEYSPVGDPFHFKVGVTGEYSEDEQSWVQRVIEKAQNVRSVLDGIEFNGGASDIELHIAALTVCETVSTVSTLIE